MSAPARPATPGLREIAVALFLFLVWSNSFVAIGLLLGREGAAARFDWVGLTVARFLSVAPFCALYCAWRWRESLEIVRRHGGRLVVSGLLAVPGYNLALNYGQAHGVPAPIASLTTALLPLFMVALAVAFLGERLTGRRLAAFTVALAGMGVIAFAGRHVPVPGGYGSLLAVTALAPLSWSLFSVVSKTVAGQVSSLLWTYLAIVIGSLPLVVLLPFRGGPEMAALDGPGWVALLFLGLLCTGLGFALWSWLLRRLPASTTALAVFLNPPLTTLSKFSLAALLPAVFAFQIAPLEWVGGGLVLSGLAIAVVAAGR